MLSVTECINSNNIINTVGQKFCIEKRMMLR